MNLRHDRLLRLSFALLAACGGASEEPTAASSSDLVRTEYTPKKAGSPAHADNYRDDPGWTSPCFGAPVSQATLKSALGGFTAVSVGRFRVALRNACHQRSRNDGAPLLCGSGVYPQDTGPWETSNAMFSVGVWKSPFERTDVTPVSTSGDVVAFYDTRFGRYSLRLIGDTTTLRSWSAAQNDFFTDGYARLVGTIDDAPNNPSSPDARVSFSIEKRADPKEFVRLGVPTDGVARTKSLDNVTNVPNGRVFYSAPDDMKLEGSLSAACLRFDDASNAPASADPFAYAATVVYAKLNLENGIK